MYHLTISTGRGLKEANEEASSSKVHDYLGIRKRKRAVTFAAE
jgi:hypothetical protein